jgi:hypothetical protein
VTRAEIVEESPATASDKLPRHEEATV